MADDPVAQHGALFLREGDRYVPTPLARGPWDPRALHGGAPSALFATVCEQHDPGPAAHIARLTVELLRPVPLAPLRLEVTTLRPGKKVQWLQAALFDGDDREVARATALRLRVEEVDTSGAVQPEVAAPPARGEAAAEPVFPVFARAVGFWHALDLRMVRGTFTEPGPAAAWFRLRCAVVDGVAVTPFARVAACADFGSGVGNALRGTNATAINAEVTIHTHRHPQGEWVCLESGAWVEPRGVGLAVSRLHDEHGVLGAAVQTLLVEPAADRPMRV
jgi:hypothetical protein